MLIALETAENLINRLCVFEEEKRKKKSLRRPEGNKNSFKVFTAMTVDYEIKVWSFFRVGRWEISFAIPSVRWLDVAESILTSIAHVTRVAAHETSKNGSRPIGKAKAHCIEEIWRQIKDKFSKRKWIACLGIWWTIKKQSFKSFPPIWSWISDTVEIEIRFWVSETFGCTKYANPAKWKRELSADCAARIERWHQGIDRSSN